MKNNPKISCLYCPYGIHGFYTVAITYPEGEYHIWSCRFLHGVDQDIPNFWNNVRIHPIPNYPTTQQLKETGCEFGDAMLDLSIKTIVPSKSVKDLVEFMFTSQKGKPREQIEVELDSLINSNVVMLMEKYKLKKPDAEKLAIAMAQVLCDLLNEM